MPTSNSQQRRPLSLTVLLLLLLAAGACVRRDGRNSDCQWPGERAVELDTARHLSADAEFAEDLAIRYADAHYGIHSPTPSDQYGLKRDECMAALFADIAKEHGVRTEQVSRSLGENRAHIDSAVYFPFALLYCAAAIALTAWIWRRYPPIDNDWNPGVVMTVFFSLAMAAGCMLCGEQWGWIAETYRIGNQHMSYRANRLWWGRHRLELFTGALLVFWVFAALAIERVKRSRGGRASARSALK